MAINKKNQNAFSYINNDTTGRNFINKNFNKAHSYHSNFFQSKFTNTSFIGASFKWCTLTGSVFQSSLLRGVLFQGSSLRHVEFNECIINACNLDHCKIESLRLNNCYVVSSDSFLRGLVPSQLNTSRLFNTFPDNDEFNPHLIDVVEKLRGNDFVRRSSVLHRKLKRIDTVTLSYLLDRFNEDFLIEQLPKVCMKIERDFHTVSYLDKLLRNQLV
ncbi:MAG: pentapeptide repeat-containing protein [Aeromonas sp.]